MLLEECLFITLREPCRNVPMQDQNTNPHHFVSLQTVKINTLDFIQLQFISFAPVTGLHSRFQVLVSLHKLLLQV